MAGQFDLAVVGTVDPQPGIRLVHAQQQASPCPPNLVRQLEGRLVGFGVLLHVVEKVEALRLQVRHHLDKRLDLPRQVDGEQGAKGLLVLFVHEVKTHFVMQCRGDLMH